MLLLLSLSLLLLLTPSRKPLPKNTLPKNKQTSGVVLSAFQLYRAAVLPAANTWMSWSLLHRAGDAPGPGVTAALGALLLGVCALGVLRSRFFLHAPLQLASVLFAASSTPQACVPLLLPPPGNAQGGGGGSAAAAAGAPRGGGGATLPCVGAVAGMQLALGLVLPGILGRVLDVRQRRQQQARGGGGRAFLPHMQARRYV